jgi:hypothetical protein
MDGPQTFPSLVQWRGELGMSTVPEATLGTECKTIDFVWCRVHCTLQFIAYERHLQTCCLEPCPPIRVGKNQHLQNTLVHEGKRFRYGCWQAFLWEGFRKRSRPAYKECRKALTSNPFTLSSLSSKPKCLQILRFTRFGRSWRWDYYLIFSR